MTPEQFEAWKAEGGLDIQDRKAQRSPPIVKLKSETAMQLYTAQGQSVSLENHYRGGPGFLVLSGPSSRNLNLGLLKDRGCVTFCVNNSWSLVRPQIWTAVDDPCTMLDAGWKDPGILKLAPYGKQEARLGTKTEKGFRWSKYRVVDMPNVLFYKRNTHFKLQEFLTQDSVNWGNDQRITDELGCQGSRSVMLAAVRLMFYLGFRTIYLVGADFHMEDKEGHRYAFPQARDPKAAKGNNNTYRDLNKRFTALRPLMEAKGLRILNCNPHSGLKAFDFADFHEVTNKIAGKYEGFHDTDGWYTWHKAGRKTKLPPGVNPK